MKKTSSSQSPNVVLTSAEFAALVRCGEERDRIEFMNLTRLPGRLTAQEAAWLLGFKPHEIPILVTYRLLQTMGAPPRNGEKHFSAGQLERLSRDFGWLDLASATLINHGKTRKQRRSKPESNQ